MKETSIIETINTLSTFHPQESLKTLVERMLKLIGEDPNREGLLKTPARFSKAFSFLTSGYTVSPEKLVGDAIFDEPDSDLVFIKNIEFYSLCEHHLLPFFGKAHVAYIPNGKVIGLSKIPRIIEVFARRLQVQERLTKEIAFEIDKILKPKGVAVIIEASHLCMMMRGIQKQNSTTVTKSMRGEFESNQHLRNELMNLLRN